MPVTRTRKPFEDLSGLDQTNTARFLFGDDEGNTEPEDHYGTSGNGDMVSPLISHHDIHKISSWPIPLPCLCCLWCAIVFFFDYLFFMPSPPTTILLFAMVSIHHAIDVAMWPGIIVARHHTLPAKYCPWRFFTGKVLTSLALFIFEPCLFILLTLIHSPF